MVAKGIPDGNCFEYEARNNQYLLSDCTNNYYYDILLLETWSLQCFKCHLGQKEIYGKCCVCLKKMYLHTPVKKYSGMKGSVRVLF